MGFIERATLRAKRFERTYLFAYLDPIGLWTSGTGFNLERGGSTQALSAVGLSSGDVWSEIERSRRIGLRIYSEPWGKLKGTHNPVMSAEQADRLLDADLIEAISDLHTLIPTFDELPDEARLVLVDMRFNMGAGAIRGFTRATIPAIVEGRYADAARFIEATPYAKQTKTRAAENVAMLRRLAS